MLRGQQNRQAFARTVILSFCLYQEAITRNGESIILDKSVRINLDSGQILVFCVNHLMNGWVWVVKAKRRLLGVPAAEGSSLYRNFPDTGCQED